MLKRFICILLALCLSVCLLCGCAGRRELDKGYMLTAIGFELEGKAFKVTAELISVSDMQEDSPKPQVMSANGVTPQNALYNLSLNFPRAVYFDHCATLVIGGGIEDERFKAVIDYCAEAENLNLNMRVINSSDIQTLFNTPTVSAAVGYHIMRLLSFKEKESGLEYTSRFYEIKNTSDKTFLLPSFIGGEEITLEGSVVFKDQKPFLNLNNTESIAYAFISGGFKEGRVSVGTEYADIKRVKYQFVAKEEKDTINAQITATLSAADITEGFDAALQSETEALLLKAQGEDIFMIEKRAIARGMISDSVPQKTEIKYRVEQK